MGRPDGREGVSFSTRSERPRGRAETPAETANAADTIEVFIIK
jgi:hypothetical protein